MPAVNGKQNKSKGLEAAAPNLHHAHGAAHQTPKIKHLAGGKPVVDIAPGDGRYLFNAIDICQGITIYHIEKNGKFMQALSLLTEEEESEIDDIIRKNWHPGETTGVPIDIQLDIAVAKKGVRFGLLVGLGEPRFG